MRLSAKKAAHHFSQLVPLLQEIREANGLFVVFYQGKPLLAIFISHSNCETALSRLLYFTPYREREVEAKHRGPQVRTREEPSARMWPRLPGRAAPLCTALEECRAR
jgi:hypothetical protein